MLDINAITASDARHVLWFHDNNQGWQPGSFTQRLLELLTIADELNFARLSKAFPGLASAHYLAQHEKNGREILSGIATKNGAENEVIAAAIMRGDF